MKKSALMMILAVMAISVSAQNVKQTVGGYGAGIAELTWVNGKPALNLGAYGGVLVNHKFLLGVAGNNVFFEQTINGKKENFQLNYYGLYAEYRIKPENPVHFSFALTGALGWQENQVNSITKIAKKDGDFTYVIQPKIGINTKIASFMQIQAYGSFRITGDTKSVYYTRGNYNGASAGISLVFGSF